MEPTKVLYETEQSRLEKEAVVKPDYKIEAIKKIKQIAQFAKKPKFIALGILLFVLVVVILALNLMSQKEVEEEAAAPPQTISQSPSPSTDPSLTNINQRIEAYNKKLDNMQDFRKTLSYPIVDLEISFEEE